MCCGRILGAHPVDSARPGRYHRLNSYRPRSMADSPGPSRYVPMPRIRTLTAGLLAATFAVGLALMPPAAVGQAPSQKKAATAQPADRIKAPKGFQVDLVYEVPRETQGSWVNLA